MNREIDELRADVAALTKAAKAEIEAEEPPGLGELLEAQRAIERVRRDLKEVLDDVSEAAAGMMPARKMRVAGLGTIERQGGIDRSGWDHDSLFDRALARGRDAPDRYDKETGEMLISEGAAVLREIREMAGTPGYWKVGALRERGLDPADFCVEKKARIRVKLPRDDRTDE